MDIIHNNNIKHDPRYSTYNEDDETYGFCLSCGKQVPSKELSRVSTCNTCEDTPMFV